MSENWDRRVNKNRRKRNEGTGYPFKDSQGKLIAYDRRSGDERRKGIHVSQADMSEEEFVKNFLIDKD